MTMLIPFWVWILVGIFIGWKARGYLGKKLSFLDKVRKPFGTKKRNRPQKAQEKDEPEAEEKTVGQKAKSAVDKVTGFLARPIEKWMGDDKEEDDE